MLGDPICGDVRVAVYQEVSYLVKASSGQGWAVILLQAPGTIGGTTYGLSSVEFCHGQSNNATIVHTTVWQSDAIGSPDVIIADGRRHRRDPRRGGRSTLTVARRSSDRTAAADPDCYPITDRVPTITEGGVSLAISLTYAAAAEAAFSTVSTKWAPATEILE